MKTNEQYDRLIQSVGKAFTAIVLQGLLCLPSAYARSLAEDLSASDDTVSMQSGAQTVIHVLANDSYPDNCTPAVTVVTAPRHGTATVSGQTVTYTPASPRHVRDSLEYELECGSDKDRAWVHITVNSLPDNIVDADCFMPASPITWDIEQKAISDIKVHRLSTPFAGDLDGDGRPEVVVPDQFNSPTTLKRILIFNDSLRLKSTIVSPVNLPDYYTMSHLIADVDNDGKGEIVTATTGRNLYCFSHDGTLKWGPTETYTIAGSASDCISLVVADIDGDGYSEILAADKIYAGESGKLLATLPPGGRGISFNDMKLFMPVFADVDNDGIQEVAAGYTVYKVTITNREAAAGNTVAMLAQIDQPEGYSSPMDGQTSVADIDLDGDLDVIVTAGVSNISNRVFVYVWDGATPAQIGNTLSFTSTGKHISRASVADTDNDGRPNILFTCPNRIVNCFYDPDGNQLVQLWEKAILDGSGAIGMSIFDFDRNGEAEIVYRDETHLRIIDRSGRDLASIPCRSGTHTEFPIVTDLDRDGHADILVTGGSVNLSDVYLIRYGSKTPGQWASARSVWNQYAYSTVNIREDLSIPRNPMNPTTLFSDSRRPYNAFMQQQTTMDINGNPVRAVPNAVFDDSKSSSSIDGERILINLCITNKGSAPLGSPVCATLYRDSIAYGNIISTGRFEGYIQRGDTACLTIDIPFTPFVQLILRLNDDGRTYPLLPECDYADNIRAWFSPAIFRMMKKHAVLNGEKNTGTYSNPVAVLFNEKIRYGITAVNANSRPGQVIITDTLPPYLDLVTGSYANATTGTYGPLSQSTISWTIANVQPLDSVTVDYEATPQRGASASQPVFINRAWVRASDTIVIPTNSTYHQGAGVSSVNFFASAGGEIYNATPQVLDYMTSPRTDRILIVPDDGYRFAGWSHDAYTSLRGDTIAARDGIMHCDTLTIYGNVELRAVFVPEASPDRYRTDAGEDIASETAGTDSIRAAGNAVYIRTSRPVVIARIYTADGVLHEQRTIFSGSTAKIRLSQGVYIVTLNNGAGRKIVIKR